MSQGLPSLVENFDYLVNHLLGLKGRAKNVGKLILDIGLSIVAVCAFI